MVGVGSLSVVAGTIFACKETLRAEEVLDKCKADLREVQVTTPDDKKSLVAAYGRNIARMGKLYAPAIVCIGGGLCTIIFGHKILNKRYITVVGAYTVLNQDYRKYRKVIKDEYGPEADIYAAHGVKLEKSKLESIGDDPCYEIKNSDIFIPDRDLSNSSIFWGAEYSIMASKNPEENFLTLRGQEEYANALFEEQGYLYLNDVYAMLGVDKIDDLGLGWVKGLGDDYIDFGIYSIKNGHAVNGDEQVFLLDFNHDGCILPYI